MSGSEAIMVENTIVMVVEDDFVDVELLRRMIGKRSVPYNLQHATDGQAALDLLRGGSLSPAQRERLIIFLDINMPGMNGHQFLSEIRSDPVLSRTIVFILSTSSHDTDRQLAYDKNVAGYFVKSNLDGLLDTVDEYVQHVKFPPRPKD